MRHHNGLAITAVLAVLLLVGCASAAEFTFNNVQIDSVGGTGTADLVLVEAPVEGFSGYIIQLEIADPSVAHVTKVSYNAELQGMTDTTARPFTSGHISWVDVNEMLQAPGGETNVLLATVTFTSLAPGSTTVGASFTMITDDNGDDMIPTSTINSPALDVYAVPEAAFSADKTTVLVSEAVTFTDESTGNVGTWDLDFGDGSAHASGAGPWTHAYASPGTYDVSLTVTNHLGTDTETKLGFITVSSEPVPVADFTATPVIGLAPLSVTFTDISTNEPSSWNWEYRASGTSDAWTPFATAQNPTYSFPAGAYDIRLTATNGGGSGSVTKTQFLSVSAGPKRLTTIQSGTVSGDLYVGAFQPVAWGDQPTTPGPRTFTQAYSIPAHTTVQWARLYAEVYAAGTDNRAGQAIVSFDADNDGTYETVLGTETLATASTSTADVYPVNDHIDRQYSDYRLWYDVTPLIGSSTTVNAQIYTTNVDSSNFDGRLKTLTLVVAYNDGDTDTVQYWVNDGHDYQPSSTGQPGITSTFGTASLASGWVSAELQNVALSSKDAVYTFNSNPIPNTPGTAPSFETNIWDVRDYLTAGSDSNFNYAPAGGSYKTILATLKARYVVPPTADFVAVPTVASTSDVIQFTDQSTAATSWAWDFGDGNTSTEQNPTHTYATTGLKTVSLTVTNPGGTDTETKTDYINVVDAYISFNPASQTFMTGELRTYTIVLSEAPQGLAGYDVWVTLGTGSVADITAVTYPAWAQNIYSPTVPADSIRIRGYDGGQAVTAGATNVVLATITVRGSTTGSTSIELSGLQMDADGGDVMSPTLQAGTVIIGTYSAPVADFQGTPTSGLAPLDVTFTDASTGDITNWYWDFDNDGTIDSEEQNPPAFTYTAAGTYTVKLTVTGPGGSDSEVKTGYIAAGVTAPVAGFSATPLTGNFPLEVTFTDASTGIISSRLWNFGDGRSSSLKDPVHTYTAAGTYDVTLTVTGPGGSDSEVKTGYITVTHSAPVADFIANPTSGTAPLTVAFSDQSTGPVASYAWDFDNDGTVDSTDQNPTHTFAAGTYNVTLTVTGPGGSDSETKISYVTASGLTANFDADQYTGVASRNVSFNVTFNDLSTGYPSGPDAWSWNFGNGGTSADQNPTVQYLGRPQSFTVTLDVSRGMDSASVTKTNFITITPYLEAFPGYVKLPTDLDGDGRYEDINGNGRLDYDDVVALFTNLGWIRDNSNVDIENYDFNFNNLIDYDDVIVLNDLVFYR